MHASLTIHTALAGWLVCSLLAAPSPSPAPAQSPPLVLVDVAVEGADGRAVDNLTQDDFEIASAGGTRPIAFFAAGTARPLSLVLLFDTTASMSAVTSRDDIRTSVEKSFVDRLTTSDRVHVGSFAAKTAIGAALSGKPLLSALRKALDPREADTFGPSPIWDAVDSAVTTLANAEGRRGILLVTDGRATGNRLSLEEAGARAVAAGVAVSVVGKDWEMTIAQDKTTGVRIRPGAALEWIAGVTGGLYLPDRSKPAAPGEILVRLLADLRGRYTLGFVPAVRDGKPHELDIRINRQGLTLRARRSYVAPNEP